MDFYFLGRFYTNVYRGQQLTLQIPRLMLFYFHHTVRHHALYIARLPRKIPLRLPGNLSQHILSVFSIYNTGQQRFTTACCRAVSQDSLLHHGQRIQRLIAAAGPLPPAQQIAVALSVIRRPHPLHILLSQLHKAQFPIDHQILSSPQQNASPTGTVILSVTADAHRRHSVAAVFQWKNPWIPEAHGIEGAILILRRQGKQYAAVMIQGSEKFSLLQCQMHAVCQFGIIQHIVYGFSGITQ